MNGTLIIGSGRFGEYLRRMLVDRGIRADSFETFELDETLNHSSLFSSFEYVVFAVAMNAFDEVLSKWKQRLHKDQIIIDVCSLKVFAVDAMKKHFPENQIIATHPLFGPQSAPGSWEGQRIMIHNVSAKQETFAKLQDWLIQTGLNTIVCTPEYHDEQMAESQALTHFIGRIAEKMKLKRTPLSTKSFDDLMDIIELVKGSSEQLFFDMQTLNPYAVTARESFIAHARDLNFDLSDK